MYGTLDLTDLYINQYKAFRKKTSFSTIRDICKEMGLGFNSNISDTKDSMTWLQRGDNIDFIRSIIKRSYISDESYLIGYIDYYYCFNYLDIEKELSRDISNDVNIDSSGVNSVDSNDVKEKTKLILTNDKGVGNSNLFIESYKILNSSMYSAINNGFFIKTRYYDSLNKTHLLFNVDSITDKDDGKIIVLKGKQNDKDYYDRNVSNNWMGKIDTDNYSFLQVKNYSQAGPIKHDKLRFHLPINFTFGEFIGIHLNVYTFDRQNQTKYDLSNFYFDITNLDQQNLMDFTSPPLLYLEKLWGKNITIDIPSVDGISNQLTNKSMFKID